MVEDRSIGCVTRQSKHFVARSEGDGEKKGSMFIPVLFVFFFSFPPIKNKIRDIPAGPEFLSEKGDRKLKLRELRDKLNTKKQQQGVKTNLFQHLLFSICFAFPYMYDWLNQQFYSVVNIYIYVKENHWYWPMQSISFTISNQSDPTCCMYTRDKRVRR